VVCVFAICLVVLLLRIPAPLSFALDADQGQQLAGARQLLHGEHPFIDFRSTYGPLTYYASAVAQIVSGGRPLGEVTLALSAYTITYTLLFSLMLRASGRSVVAAFWLGIALLTSPRFYKYYIVAGPVLVLWTGWRYREEPSRLRLWLTAGAVTATALYRLDFGVYAGLTAAFLVAVDPMRWTERGRRLVVFAVACLAWASPWLLWAWTRGGLGNYLVDSLRGIEHARGMALPFPRPAADDPWSLANGVWVAFVACFMLPIVTVLVACLRRPWSDTRADVVGAALLGQGTLLQASHRSDLPHLLQAIPVLYVSCAWLTGEALEVLRRGGLMARVCASVATFGLVGLAAVLAAAAHANGSWPQWTPRQAVSHIVTYANSRPVFLDVLEREYPNEPALHAIRYLRDCTRAEQRILALPLLTSYYYLSDRAFGGEKMYLAPGFFNAPADEARMIEVMRRQDVAAVVDQPDLVLDGDARRRMAVYAPAVSRFLDGHYVETDRFGPLRVRLRADLVSTQAGKRVTPCRDEE
jgi:hypothetical protein